MRTTVVLVIDHKKPIPDLANLAAQRVYTIDGVADANVVASGEAPDAEVDAIADYYTSRKNGPHAAKSP